MPTRRMERMARAIQTEVSQVVLFELGDPRLQFVTVTRVEVSPDLRNAKVFVSILGNDGEAQTSLHTLEHARGHIQRLIGDRLPTRYVPLLQFQLDPSVKKSIELSKIISDALADSKSGSESPSPESAPTDPAEPTQPAAPDPDKRGD